MNAVHPFAASALAEAPTWWEDRLVAAPGVRSLRLGQRAALFCERSQQLFELTAVAERLWHALAQGRSPRAAARDLAADEGQSVRAAVDTWFDAGHLLPAAVATRAQGRPDTELPLRIADFAATIAIHDGGAEALARELHATFGQFLARRTPDAARISVVADADAWFVLLDQALLGRFAADRIVPQLKAILTDRLAQSVGGGAFLLHAALLTRSGRGLLVSGAPGAGKTTLALTLAAHGWGYGSDDIVRVDAGGGLEGVPFSPAMKSGAWPLLASHLPAIGQLPTHLRGDGQRVRYAPVRGLDPARADALGWAVILDRQAGARAELEPVDPLSMLTHLLGGAFSADHRLHGETLDRFAAQLAGADCRRLRYCDLTEAVAALAAMPRG